MRRPPIHVRLAHAFARMVNRVGDLWNDLISPIERAIGGVLSWLGDRWSDLISPIERVVGGVSHRLFGATDSFDDLESAVLRGLRFLFWPLIFLGRMVGKLLPSKELDTRSGRVFASINHVGVWVVHTAERFNLDGVLYWIVWLLTPVWWPIATVLGFAQAWLATRRARELALAVPALVLAAPFAYVAVQGAKLARPAIAERYKLAVRDAIEQGEYSRAHLYERKLAQMGVDTSRTDFNTALALEEGGDLSGAYERMTALATPDVAGYPQAHLWIAQHLLSGALSSDIEPAATDMESASRLALRHLDRLRELRAAGRGIAQLRAFAHYNVGELEAAADELAPFSVSSLEAASLRMRVLFDARDAERAREQARAVLLLMEELPEDAPIDFGTWTTAAVLVGDLKEIESAVLAWRDAEPDAEQPAQVLGAIRRLQSEQYVNDPTTAPSLVANVMREAVALEGPIRWTAALATRLGDQREESDHFEKVWSELADANDTPDSMLEMMAAVAAERGDITGARRIYRRLIKGGSKNPVVWNNFAWLLAQEPNPDLRNALRAANRALRLAPDDHRFRETRGQVFVEQKRWKEAVEDLEYAINGLPDLVGAHRSLATAYDALGKPQLAELHRDQAAR